MIIKESESKLNISKGFDIDTDFELFDGLSSQARQKNAKENGDNTSEYEMVLLPSNSTNFSKNFLNSALDKTPSSSDILPMEERTVVMRALIETWNAEIQKCDMIINNLEKESKTYNENWSEMISKSWVEVNKIKRELMRDVRDAIKSSVQTENKSVNFNMSGSELKKAAFGK